MNHTADCQSMHERSEGSSSITNDPKPRGSMFTHPQAGRAIHVILCTSQVFLDVERKEGKAWRDEAASF